MKVSKKQIWEFIKKDNFTKLLAERIGSFKSIEHIKDGKTYTWTKVN